MKPPVNVGVGWGVVTDQVYAPVDCRTPTTVDGSVEYAPMMRVPSADMLTAVQVRESGGTELTSDQVIKPEVTFQVARLSWLDEDPDPAAMREPSRDMATCQFIPERPAAVRAGVAAVPVYTSSFWTPTTRRVAPLEQASDCHLLRKT